MEGGILKNRLFVTRLHTLTQLCRFYLVDNLDASFFCLDPSLFLADHSESCNAHEGQTLDSKRLAIRLGNNYVTLCVNI